MDPRRVVCSRPGCPEWAYHRGECEGHSAETGDRGYGVAHRRARARLAQTLPRVCHYCPREVSSSDRWDACHVIDGDPSAGWVVGHSACNQRAKGTRDRGSHNLPPSAPLSTQVPDFRAVRIPQSEDDGEPRMRVF